MASQPTAPVRPNLRVVLRDDPDARRAVLSSAREAAEAAATLAGEVRRAYEELRPHIRALSAAVDAFSASVRSSRGGTE